MVSTVGVSWHCGKSCQICNLLWNYMKYCCRYAHKRWALLKSASINWTSFVEHENCSCWMISVFVQSDSSPSVVFHLYQNGHGKPCLDSNHCWFQWRWETLNSPHGFTIGWNLPVIFINNSWANYIFRSPSSLPSPFGLPEPEDKSVRFFETLITIHQSTDITFADLNSSNIAVRTLSVAIYHFY